VAYGNNDEYDSNRDFIRFPQISYDIRLNEDFAALGRCVTGAFASITSHRREPKGSQVNIVANQPHRTIFLALLMLLMPLTPLLMATPVQAGGPYGGTAAPLDVLMLGSGNIDDPVIVGDSQGNFHVMWVENSTKLMYAQIDSDGAIVNGPAVQPFGGSSNKDSLAMDIDDADILHYLVIHEQSMGRCLRYVAADPFSDSDTTDDWFDPSNYSSGFVTCYNQQGYEFANPAIVADSQGAAHVVWESNYGPLNNRFGLPGIHYAMMEANWTTQVPDSPISNTMLTTAVSKSTHPDVAITPNDEVVVTWQDSRGSMVEVAAILPSTGSISDEWSDFCVMMYGGSDITGWSTQGLKQMADDADVVLLETIYALGDYIPWFGSTSGCNGYSTGQRSRSVMLTPQDDSGQIRKLHRTMYNGAAASFGAQYEDWGPGTTWACLSWMDVNGNTGNNANPPTQHDHRWNPEATKFVIPLGVEGPKGGDPAQQSDDTQSINEAHDACVDGGVTVVPLLGNGLSSNSNNMWSHALDLAHCPNSGVSTGSRNCIGYNARTTDISGSVREWPSSGNNLGFLYNSLLDVVHSGSPEIWTTVLDPYALLGDPGHVRGTPGHGEVNGQYVEDTGWGGMVDDHFVVVNDTRITDDYASSTRPQVEIASNGFFEYIWTDSRSVAGMSRSDPQEIYWRRVNLNAWDFDGQAAGIDISSISGADTGVERLSSFDVTGNVGSRDVAAHSAQPAFAIDADDKMHLAWVEHDDGQEVNISYTRSMDAKQGVLQTAPTPWWTGCSDGDSAFGCRTAIYDLSPWDSNKMGAGERPLLIDPDENDGGPPALAITSDRRRTAAVAWIDNEPCDSSSTIVGEHLCLRRIQRSLLQIDPVVPSLTRTLEPGERVTFNFTIEHLGSVGEPALTAHLDWDSLMSSDWDVTAIAGTGAGATLLTPIDANLQITSGGTLPISLTIVAPSKQAATEQEHHLPSLAIVSDDESHRDAVSLDITFDVDHFLWWNLTQDRIEIEQGSSGILSIELANYGNLYEDVRIPSAESEYGRTIWGLPFGWEVDFPTAVTGIPDEDSISKLLTIDVPSFQSPGEVNLTLYVFSSKVVNPEQTTGATTSRMITVDVIRKRAGNVVFELWDSLEQIGPGECADFDVRISKNYGNDDVKFILVDGPVERPGSIDEDTWRQDHWTATVDFAMLPGGNTVPFETGRYFTDGMTREIKVEICAPYSALAAARGSLTLRAELKADALASDQVTMEVEVTPEEALSATWVASPTSIEPGQTFEVEVFVENVGNVPQTFAVRAGEEIAEWQVQMAPEEPNGLVVGAATQMVILVTVPLNALAGETNVVIEFHSVVDDDSYRTAIERSIVVLPRIDLQLHLANGQAAVLDLRLGDTTDIAFIVENAGNWAEAPWLENHTTGVGGSLSTEPRLDGLTGLQTKWYVVENAGTPLALYTEILPNADGRLTLPSLEPGETVPVVFRMSLFGHPGWDSDELAIRLRSVTGYAAAGGDIDADDKWLTEDNNEQIIRFNVFAPELYVLEVSEELDGDDVKLQIKIQNSGNDPAENLLVRVCDMTLERAEAAGCDRNDAIAEQRVPYIGAAVDGVATTHVIAVRIAGGVSPVVVAVDAENEVIEVDESNNMMERELLLVGGSNPEGTTEELIQFVSDNGLMVLMFGLWAGIILLVFTTWRSRTRDRGLTSKGGWSEGDGWGGEAVGASTKPKKKRRFKSKKEPTVEDDMQIATIHSMDAPSVGGPVDTSDLELTPDDPPPPSAPTGALEPLGEQSYDPTEKKVEKDEQTIGDIIDDLW
jgi:hypothetical protein